MSSPMNIQGMQFGLQQDAAINQQGVLLELEELLLKFIRKNEEPRRAKMIFKMKERKLILLYIVIKTT